MKNYKNYIKEDADFSTEKELELVHGEDVRYWYLVDHYEKVPFEYRVSSSLYNSCYRFKEKQHIFDLYVENPEKLGLLILRSSKNRLLARAVLIKLDSPKDHYFMDYPYLIYEKHEKLFEEYVNSHNCFIPEQIYMKIPIYCVLKKKVDTCYPPYFDSIPYLQIEENKIVVGNYEGSKKLFGYHTKLNKNNNLME